MKVLPLPRPPPSNPEASLSDAALLAACGVGEEEALGQLFDRHQALVRRFLRRSGCPAPDLDDLVQATFLEVWRSARRFRGRSQVTTFILGIAQNLRRHQARGEGRRQLAHHALARVPADSPPTPVALVEAQDLVARAELALSALPDGPRQGFVLCVLEGLPLAEAAQILDVRPGTLGRWVHEGRAALRRAAEIDDD